MTGEHAKRFRKERMYDPVIVQLLGYIAEKTDLLSKLAELEIAYASGELGGQLKDSTEAETKVYRMILASTNEHVSPQNHDFNHILASQAKNSTPVRTAIDELAAFPVMQAEQHTHSQQKHRWREVAGKIAIDMIFDMHCPRNNIATLLDNAMIHALEKRQDAEVNGHKKKTYVTPHEASLAQAINSLIYPANKSMKAKGRQEIHLTNPGACLLLIANSSCSPESAKQIDQLELVMKHFWDHCRHKPSLALKAAYDAFSDFVKDDRTHAGTISKEREFKNEIDELYQDVGG